AAELSGDLAANNITSYYSPFFTYGERDQTGVVSLLHFGDIMLDRNVKKIIDRQGENFLLQNLAGTENRFFSGVDIVAANLEGPFADTRRPTSKSIAFRFDPKLIPMLRRYRFSLFTNANNHTYDMGRTGFIESQDNLRQAGLDFYGEQFQVNEKSLLIRAVGGKKLAFIGLNDTHAPQLPVDMKKTLALLKQAEAEADLTIINIHWGQEYKTISNERQRDLAHAFIDAGADVVIGHHPHVVEEMEIYKNRPIFYSLGNFIFDQYFSETTQQGMGVGLVFYDTATAVTLFPLVSETSSVRQMSGPKRASFMRNFIDTSRLGAYNLDASYHLIIPYEKNR
ncbi:MAG: CapA family protein, partial [Candidatus Magasanikbacteria bacterium]|nr:CapA family protein [Candidatus Magasanikbacteria bacterium]